MSKESWVGFPDVQEKTGNDITIGYTGMPVGLDLGRLQLNVDATRRGVIGWGGYSAVTLAAYEGDEDKYHIGGSPDSTGTAAASGVASVTRAEASNNQISSDQKLNAINVRNGVLGIQWNINALNGRLPIDQQYDPGVRAAQLRRVVQWESIKAIWKHNTLDYVVDSMNPTNIAHALFDGG